VGQWETIAATYDIDCWFCDPHAPWQRGQVENLNRQWRWWFPRGTDLKAVQPAAADHAASIINGQRRRSLGYQSPTALYAAATVQWSLELADLAIKETNAKVFPKGTLLVAMHGEGQTRGRIAELGIDAATNQAVAALLFDVASVVIRPYLHLFFLETYERIRRQ
jgi:hypothetical protein